MQTNTNCEVVALTYAAGPLVPNHPQLPAVLMRQAVGGGASGQEVARHYAAHDWRGAWVWSVFRYHHYHPDAHEVLTVLRGSATLALGGSQGSEHDVMAGDVLMLPAGFGHCLLKASSGFQVCGAYPAGQENYSTIHAEQAWPGDLPGRLDAVPLPTADPIFGADGPLMGYWQKP